MHHVFRCKLFARIISSTSTRNNPFSKYNSTQHSIVWATWPAVPTPPTHWRISSITLLIASSAFRSMIMGNIHPLQVQPPSQKHSQIRHEGHSHDGPQKKSSSLHNKLQGARPTALNSLCCITHKYNKQSGPCSCTLSGSGLPSTKRIAFLMMNIGLYLT
jgi:hypothetical protein